MTSVLSSAAHATARADKLHRLSVTLRQFGDAQIASPVGFGGAGAATSREFGEANRGAADWLAGLADAATAQMVGHRELDRIARRAAAACAIAGKVAVRVDVTARRDANVDAGALAALRELCETAPAVVGYLLGLIEADPRREPVVGDALAEDLNELVARGLIVGERDAGGELRFRPSAPGQAGS